MLKPVHWDLEGVSDTEEQGKSVVIVTSAIDTRDELRLASSRIGMKRRNAAIERIPIFLLCLKPSTIKLRSLIDEASHFSKTTQCLWLARVVDGAGHGFGLCYFRNELFEGSTPPYSRQVIEEITSIRQYFCSRKRPWSCRRNLRVKPV